MDVNDGHRLGLGQLGGEAGLRSHHHQTGVLAMSEVTLTKVELEIFEQVVNEGSVFIADDNYHNGIPEEETAAYSDKQRMITVALRNEGEVLIKVKA